MRKLQKNGLEVFMTLFYLQLRFKEIKKVSKWEIFKKFH